MMNHSKHLPHLFLNFLFIFISVFFGFVLGIYCKANMPKDIISDTPETTTLQQTENHTEEIPNASVSQRLIIAATEVNDPKYFVRIDEEYLNGTMDFSLLYTGLKDVSIELDGGSKRLEDAIHEGNISIGEIFAYARLDSINGFCTEHAQSCNGLTTFTYTYPNLCIRLVYDLYETPDGKQHLINDFAVYNVNMQPLRAYVDDAGYLLDREDWGLSFEVMQQSQDSITLQYTQSGGQQFGDLFVDSFYIISQKGNISAKKDGDKRFHNLPHIILHNETSTQFTIDWTDIYGSLPSGNYKLCIQIRDNYDPNTLHPFTKNYHDAQLFWIEFSIV